MLSGVFAFSWSKWSASPTLCRWQFVMRAAEWADQGGAGTEPEVRGASDRGGEGYGAVVPEVMTRSRRSTLMVTSNQKSNAQQSRHVSH